MKKMLIFVALLIILLNFFILSGCSQDNSRSKTDHETNNINPPSSVEVVDTDGDTVPDSHDCAINNSALWQLLLLYLDADGDNIPDDWLATQLCVGLPNTYAGWTTTPPPPVDPCPNDPNNTCGEFRPYLEIDFAFSTGSKVWGVYGTCFPPPDPPDDFPEMGNGEGINNTITNDLNPNAVIIGYCDFAITFDPAENNRCGNSTYWFPCQDQYGNLYSGLDGDGLADLRVYLSSSGTGTDEILLSWIVVVNDKGGGNFRVDLQSANSNGDDINIIANLPIDTDGDGVLNPNDNCIWVENPNQQATPGNPFGANGQLAGDAYQGIDNDNDGWLNANDNYPADSSRH
jgi:hypothetical protein